MTRWLRVLILGLFGLVVAGCGGDTNPQVDEAKSKVKEEEINKAQEEAMMQQGKGPSKGN